MAGKRRKVVKESEPDLELDFDLGDCISFDSEDYAPPSSDLDSDDGESGESGCTISISSLHFCILFFDLYMFLLFFY